ncbi:M20/M25/M40 family metallo-hydrolase [candidate division KSB1 bacterium]|nr:M20/M25/M40 family metallo-hydrolase [candidate division KSB1 bacterium]NIR70553.1 M20/M25/M40 family metallo-hydrolase [candidate division KSB1 bacterium]NIS27699.1 M20/M25/M40 family metallo-hydrolase [candidate division KSB1 bacterium]NIT74530.1 M20/M25/M40 family metallo-hydrolase [candidate division KSB1 bacterium]NIU28352.1 M20/M25/M40 family metallo-hydrolase [candidate division KSB1 bacterium]
MKVAVIYNKRHVETSDVIDVFGPQTKERYNPKTVEKVAAALEHDGHNVRVVEGNINVAEELGNFMPRVIAGERPGMIFNMAYGIQGQSRYTHIPALLEMLGLPYVGSGPEAHAIALDKVMSKIIFRQHGLPTPQFWVFSNSNENMDDVTYPVIVKPKMEAVSMGLEIVDNQKDLRQAVQFVIENFQQQALAEAFISGREFAVGLLGNGTALEVLPIVEFDLRGDPNTIQTQEDKMAKPLEKICPAKISDELADQMRELACGALGALGIQDFARIDLRMDADGNLYILELNSMASLGATGSYVHAAQVAGYTYTSLVNRMLEVAAMRYFGKSHLEVSEPEDNESAEAKPLRVQVRSHVRSNLTTLSDNLCRMVGINSFVHNTEGVNQLGRWISSRLRQVGFHRQIYPQSEVGNVLYFSNHDAEQNHILLLGHLDTFYSYQDYIPFREERGRFYGSGVAESKGGLATMLAALRALRFTRRFKKVRCGILLTSDNALGGRFSKELVSELAARSGCVVGLKHGDLDGGIVTSCAGRLDFQIELTNIKSVHLTHVPNVIKTISQKVISWQKLTSEEKGILVQPNALEARILYGLAPDYATTSLFVQFKEANQGKDLEKKIRQIAQKGLNSKLQVRIKKGVYRPPVVEGEQSKKFFEHVQKVAKRQEIKVKSVHRLTSSDICYVPEGIPVLEGLGPLGKETHSPSEYILRDSLIDRATILAMVIRLSTDEL